MIGHGYGYGDQKTIDLSACESRHLWPILDQAREIGLPVVYPGNLGPVPPPGTAELCLDVQTHRVCLIGHSHVALSFCRTPGEAVD